MAAGPGARLLLGATILVAASVHAPAQTLGTILGTATDNTGAVIP